MMAKGNKKVNTSLEGIEMGRRFIGSAIAESGPCGDLLQIRNASFPGHGRCQGKGSAYGGGRIGSVDNQAGANHVKISIWMVENRTAVGRMGNSRPQT